MKTNIYKKEKVFEDYYDEKKNYSQKHKLIYKIYAGPKFILGCIDVLVCTEYVCNGNYLYICTKLQ